MTLCVLLASQQHLITFNMKQSKKMVFTTYNRSNHFFSSFYVGEEQSNHFLIYIDGWTQSRVIVLKLDQEDSSVTECAHTLIPPENRLIRSTGGILFIPGTAGENHDIPIAVVCGGEFGLYISASSNNVPNKHCMILNKHKPPANAIARTSSSLSMAFQLSAGGTGSLNTQRLGAASVVVDGGRTLWVTSGSGQGTSEFVSLSKNPDIISLPTNGLGPAFSLTDHCLEKISPGVAVLIGGKNSESGSCQLLYRALNKNNRVFSSSTNRQQLVFQLGRNGLDLMS